MDVGPDQRHEVVLLSALALVVLGLAPTTITPAQPSTGLQDLDACDACGAPIQLSEVYQAPNTTTENETGADSETISPEDRRDPTVDNYIESGAATPSASSAFATAFRDPATTASRAARVAGSSAVSTGHSR